MLEKVTVTDNDVGVSVSYPLNGVTIEQIRDYVQDGYTVHIYVNSYKPIKLNKDRQCTNFNP